MKTTPLLFLQKKKNDNIFSLFLNILNIKYTEDFSSRYYNEHPYKECLYGLKCMLTDYKIGAKGYRIETIEEFLQLPLPVIAQTGNGLVIVINTDNDHISYYWEGMLIKNTYEEFRETWTGVVLVAETDEESIEPGYPENRKKELLYSSVRIGFIGICGLLFVLLLYNSHIWESVGSLILLALNVIGAYTSYLLLKKQLKIYSQYADKICSMFKKSDCNSVLESPAAKIFGSISWSEIGLGYFVSNILLILLTPKLMTWQALVCICALPYPLWSIWYQKKKAKQWCPLCLVVQAVLILSFMVNLLLGYFTWPVLSIENISMLIILYSLPVLVLILLSSFIRDKNKGNNTVYEMNSLRMRDEVFKAILKNQDFYKISTDDSPIIWGNINAPIRLSVVTNPYCQPCAKMHKRLEKLHDIAGDRLSIQYFFIAFNDDLKKANETLTAIYLKNDINKFLKIMDEWYESGKFHWDDFKRKYDYDTQEECVMRCVGHQDNWLELNKIHATPTILVNGYKLPYNYKVEDLVYFLDLSIS